MKILIGSAALLTHGINIGRNPADLDYFTDQEFISEDKKLETFAHNDLIDWFGKEDRVATLDELYTIKVSHIFWDLKNTSWEKHVHDIILMEKAGAKLDLGFYTVLYSIWEERYGKKQAKLNVAPEDFFKSSVRRIYDHDSIHASVAYYGEPLFNRILRDGSAVAVDISKWESLSHEDKIRTVREEVYATALERQIIPSEYTSSPRAAYHWALKKTITSFSKGWFPLFIVTHLAELWNPEIDYVARHKENADRLIKLEEGQNVVV